MAVTRAGTPHAFPRPAGTTVPANSFPKKWTSAIHNPVGPSMGDEERVARDKANEISALRVSLILLKEQREHDLRAGRMDLAAIRESKIGRIERRLKELGESA